MENDEIKPTQAEHASEVLDLKTQVQRWIWNALYRDYIWESPMPGWSPLLLGGAPLQGGIEYELDSELDPGLAVPTIIDYAIPECPIEEFLTWQEEQRTEWLHKKVNEIWVNQHAGAYAEIKREEDTDGWPGPSKAAAPTILQILSAIEVSLRGLSRASTRAIQAALAEQDIYAEFQHCIKSARRSAQQLEELASDLEVEN